MIINRVWAMPNKWTFTIKPIKELLNRYVGDGKNWIDPFAGKYSPAEFTNDLNPKMPTQYHLDALEFCKNMTEKFNGVIFDPPYSSRQIKECYESIGRSMDHNRTKHAFFDDVKTVVAQKIKNNGYAISFGWNSNGFGINRGYEIIEILIVAHGGHHNDTICVVEKRLPTLFDD